MSGDFTPVQRETVALIYVSVIALQSFLNDGKSQFFPGNVRFREQTAFQAFRAWLVISVDNRTAEQHIYLVDMRDRGQSRKRITNVKSSLQHLDGDLIEASPALPAVKGGAKRKGRSKRL